MSTHSGIDSPSSSRRSEDFARPHLEMRDPGGQQRILNFDGVEEIFTFGRSRHNRIVLQDPVVSARHARLTLAANGARIQDLRSKHGTKVNGARLTPGAAAELHDCDEVRIGQTVLRYVSYRDRIGALYEEWGRQPARTEVESPQEEPTTPAPSPSPAENASRPFARLPEPRKKHGRLPALVVRLVAAARKLTPGDLRWPLAITAFIAALIGFLLTYLRSAASAAG